MAREGLDGAVAIVSGAARGLGAAYVHALREAGATVVGFDVAGGAEVVADASDADDVRTLVRRSRRRSRTSLLKIRRTTEGRMGNEISIWERYCTTQTASKRNLIAVRLVPFVPFQPFLGSLAIVGRN